MTTSPTNATTATLASAPSSGPTATGFEVPAEVVASLGKGKRPPVVVTVNGYTYRNTVAYFLRLPDGNPEGTGYPGTGNRSLKLFAEGRIGTFAAIDGSTSYEGWSELVAALRDLITMERGPAPAGRRAH